MTEVESFLGFANYHRDFIQGFADIASDLYSLTGPKATFTWGEFQQNAYEKLKKALCSAPVLAFPNDRDTFILDTDATSDISC